MQLIPKPVKIILRDPVIAITGRPDIEVITIQTSQVIVSDATHQSICEVEAAERVIVGARGIEPPLHAHLGRRPDLAGLVKDDLFDAEFNIAFKGIGEENPSAVTSPRHAFVDGEDRILSMSRDMHFIRRHSVKGQLVEAIARAFADELVLAVATGPDVAIRPVTALEHFVCGGIGDRVRAAGALDRVLGPHGHRVQFRKCPFRRVVKAHQFDGASGTAAIHDG